MINELISWPTKLSTGSQIAQDFFIHFKTKLPPSPKKIAFIGMGGSGIAGRLIKTILDKKSDCTSIIVDGPEIPTFIDATYTAIVVSYSGNTWETVCALEELLLKKVPVIVLCHGGTLLEMAQKNSLPFALIPECSAPRAAVGYMLGFLCQFFDDTKLLQGKTILSLVDALLQKELKNLENKEFYKDFLTLAQGRDFFHIWGISQDSAAVAYRAQTQFNENSKVQAVFSSFPELNHNLVVGLTVHTQKPLVLFFSSAFLSKELYASKKSAEQILEKQGVLLYKAPVFGDTWEEQLFMMIVWADFASYYLGKARSVDITSTLVIDQLKASYLKNLQTF